MAYELYETDHRLITSDTDFKRAMKPSAILNFFQEIAGMNSEEMGIGYSQLHPRGLFWVLSKIYVEMSGSVMYGDDIHIKTWPHIPNKAIFERSFSIEKDGTTVARALSRWCLLDSVTGRIAHASQVEYRSGCLIERRAVDFFDWRIPLIEHKSEVAFFLKIAHSEYDLNYHVNNVRYADYIFNCFTIEELKQMKLRSFQINYVKQSYEKDRLSFYREKVGERVYVEESVKNDSETVISARVCFD